MEYATERRINYKASAWTVGVHLILLFILLFIRYGTPVIETPAEMGMEVNLGSSDNGVGESQPMEADNAAQNIAADFAVSSPEKNVPTSDILKTDEADAPSIKNDINRKTTTPTIAEQNKKTANQKTTDNPRSQNTTTQRPRYVFTGNTSRGGNNASANKLGKNEGNTYGNADRGMIGGTPGSANYTGIPGKGNGISHTLSGRSIIAYPPPDASFKEGGKVVIRITVNRDGAIVNKTVKSSTNAEIRSIALRKIDKVKFNKSDIAPEEQFGDITFVFKTRD